MINKKIMVLAIFLVGLLAISAVNAASDTISTDTNNSLILQENNDESLILDSELEETQSMGSDPKSFTDLHNLINVEYATNDTIFLNDDFAYCDDDGEFKDGIVIERALTICGNGNTIDGSHSARIFKVTNSGVIFDNINFINANAADNGGAIYCDGDNCSIYGCNFTENSVMSDDGAMTHGGAVYCEGNDCRIDDCIFINNDADYGGAIYCKANDCSINSCSFNDNSAIYGGAIYCRSNNVDISACDFINNTVSYYGGAIYCDGDNCSICDCIFNGNGANYGGAVCCGRDNCSIYDCNFTDNDAHDGGAIYCRSNNVSIGACDFISNNALNDGGAVYCSGNGFTINNCSFADNSAGYGGAVYCSGNGCLMSDCIFTGNGVNLGGAVYCDGGDCHINNCSFADNGASYGGAVYCSGNGCSISDCNFTENRAENYGGAVCCGGDDCSISDCIFTNNAAINNFNFTYEYVRIYGGAVYCDGSNLLIDNCDFINNTAINEVSNRTSCYGGAIYLSGSTVSINDCRFINNSAWDSGGAICFNGNDNIVNNCNFTNNSVRALGGAIFSDSSDCLIDDCNFTNNTAVCGGAVYFVYDGHVFNSTFYKNYQWIGFIAINGGQMESAGGAIYILGKGVIVNSKFYKNEGCMGSAIYSHVNALDLRDCEFIANKGIHPINVGWGADLSSGYTTITLVCDNNYINAIYKKNNKITVSNVTYWDGKIVNSDDGYPINKFLGLQLNSIVKGSDGNIYYNASYTAYIENGTVDVPFDLSLIDYPNGFTTFIVAHNDDDYYYNFSADITLEMYDRAPSSTRINTAESEFIYGNCYINFTAENTMGYYVVITNENGEIVYEIINRSGNQQSLDDPLISPPQGQGYNYNELIFVDLPAGYYNMTVYGLGSLFIRSSSDSKLFRILPLNSTIRVDAVSEIIYNDPINVEIIGENLTTVNVTVYDSNRNIVFSQNTTERAIAIPVLPVGTYNITAVHYGNENITGCADSTVINILKASNNVIVSVDDVIYGDDAIVVITADKSGEYTVNINGTVKTVDVVNGAGNTSISLNAGYYWANASFDNPNYESIITNDTFNVLKAATSIAAIDMATAHDVDRYIVITLEDNKGNPISDAEITVELGGQNKYATDSKGQVKAPINGLDEGKYTANITFAGNENYLGSNATVNVTITDGTTFYDLNRIINDNDDAEIILSNDYAYNPYFDSDFINGVEIVREVTVDGNGHTIDGLHIARIFNITGNNVIIKNINFINGTASNGGAIYCSGNGSTINNCNFTNNSAKRNEGGNHLDNCNVKIYGGAIYCSGDDFTINNCVFTGNSAKSEGYANYLSDVTVDIGGGAIYCCGNDFTINNCSFTSNSVRGDGIAGSQSLHTKLVDIGGGAVYCRGDNLLIHDSNFINNSVVNNFAKFNFSTSCAGAIYCQGDNLTIYDCIFINNSAFAEDTSDSSVSGGGAVYCLGDNLTIYDCIFINNSAFVNTFVMSTRSDGGAIYWSGNILSIHDCNFTNNTAIDNGGAIFCNGNDYNINHCNFTNNTGKSGGGIYCNGNGFPISDCIFINNTALARDKSNGGGAIYFYMGGTVNNCEFEGNRALPSITDFYRVEGCGGAIYFASDGNVFNSTFYKNNATARWGNSDYNGNYFMPGGGAIYIVGNGVVDSSKFYKNVARCGSAILSENKILEIINSEFISNKGIMGGKLTFSISLPSSMDFNISCPNNYINAIYKYSGSVAMSNVTYWNGQIVNTDDGYPIRYYLGVPFKLGIIGCDGNNYYDVLYMPNGTYIFHFDVSTANYPNGQIIFTISPTVEDYYTGEISVTIDNERVYTRTATSTNITTSENEFVYGNCYISFTTGKTEGYYIVITNEKGDVVYEKRYMKVEDPEFNPLINQIQNGYDFNERIFVDLPAGLYNITVYGLGSFLIRGSSDSKLFRILPLDSTISVRATDISLPFNGTVNVNAALDPVDAGTLIYSSSNSSVVTVDADGNVHAVGIGRANVTVSLADNGVYAAESKVVSVEVTSIDLNWHYLDNLEWLNLDGAAITTPWTDFPKTSAYGSLPIGYEITIQLNDSNIIKSYVKDSEGNFDVNLTGVSPGTYTATFSAYGYTGAVAAVSVTQADAEIIIDNPVVDLEVLDEVPVGASLTPADAGNLTYSVSNSSVVKVEDGKIIAIGEGTATITVSLADNGVYAAESKTITVSVSLRDAGVSVNNSTLDLFVGDESGLVTVTVPGGLAVNFTSSDSSVVSVGADGKVNALANGTAVITVSVGGDGVYALNSTNVTVTVSKIASEINLAYDDNDRQLTVTFVDDAAGLPVGGATVSVKINGVLTKVKTDSNGQAIVSTADLAPGTYKVSVSYNGGYRYNPSQVSDKIIVKANTTVSADYSDVDRELTVTFVDDGTGLPVGGATVSVKINGVLTKVKTDSNGQAIVSTADLAPGTYKATVSYNGGSRYNPSKTTEKIIVKANTTVSADYGDVGRELTVTFVDDGTGLPVGGATVSVKVNGVLTKVKTDSNGQAKVSTADLAQGTYTVAVYYNGGYRYNPSQVSDKIIVKANTSLSVDYGDVGRELTVTFADNVTGQPIGGATLSVKINGNLTKVKTDSSGQAKVSTDDLAPGTYTATVSYNGGAKYNPSKTTEKIIVKANTTLSVDYNDSGRDLTVTFVDNVTGQPIGGATLSVRINGNLTKVKTDSSGQAKVSTADLAPGTYTAAVYYNGGTRYNPSQASEIIIV